MLVWLVHTLSQLFETAAQKTAEAEVASTAKARASTERIEADRLTKQQHVRRRAFQR